MGSEPRRTAGGPQFFFYWKKDLNSLFPRFLPPSPPGRPQTSTSTFPPQSFVRLCERGAFMPTAACCRILRLSASIFSPPPKPSFLFQRTSFWSSYLLLYFAVVLIISDLTRPVLDFLFTQSLFFAAQFRSVFLGCPSSPPPFNRRRFYQTSSRLRFHFLLLSSCALPL